MTTFADAEIPTDEPPSQDLACQVCGVPLTYGGRGAKPKYCVDHKKAPPSGTTRVSTRSSRDVDSALTTMEQMYRGVGFLVYLLSTKPANRSTPRAAHEWNEIQVPKLLAADREIFTQDPKLCARISGVGAKGSTGMFVFVHTMAVIPVVSLVRDDIALRGEVARAERATAQRAAETGDQATDQPNKAAGYMP